MEQKHRQFDQYHAGEVPPSQRVVPFLRLLKPQLHVVVRLGPGLWPVVFRGHTIVQDRATWEGFGSPRHLLFVAKSLAGERGRSCRVEPTAKATECPFRKSSRTSVLKIAGTAPASFPTYLRSLLKCEQWQVQCKTLKPRM